MKASLKRVLGLLLVLSTSAWSQGLCPMMLFPQTAKPCGTEQKASVPHHQMAQHDCCPRARRSTEKVNPVKLSSCSSTMPCCTVDRQPATSSKVMQASPDMAVMGRVVPSHLHVSSPAQL